MHDLPRRAARGPQQVSIGPYSSIREMAKALATRKVSSVELTEMYLGRLKTLGAEHNAVAELTEELALKQAKQADEKPTGSILNGIPFGAKDLLATKGIPTRWGSPGHDDQVFHYNATVIDKLAGAGAVLAAKLEMIELAGGGNYNVANASRMGPCLSAWDKSLWAGGSSSGSGAATALGCVGFSLGSETSGSIVCPSAFNGATGFRPTYGRVSRYGAMALCWTLDKLGPICRSADDCGLVLEAIAGPDPKDVSSLNQKFNLRTKGPKPKIFPTGWRSTSLLVPRAQALTSTSSEATGSRSFEMFIKSLDLRLRLKSKRWITSGLSGCGPRP